MNLPTKLSSQTLAAKPSRVDTDSHTIHDARIVTAGQAKGHGVWLDQSFIQSVVAMGQNSNAGLKARFGHPSMCSTALGTFVGRWKDIREKEGYAIGNLHLSNAAADTPHGDLRSYIEQLAASDPDMFGTSIVFTPDGTYMRSAETGEPTDDETEAERDADGRIKQFVACESLHACDFVDEPAANPDGLFASAWNRDTFVSQATEFLDMNPEALELLTEHPEVVQEFLSRYEAMRDKLGASTMPDEPTPQEEIVEPAVVTDETDVAASIPEEPSETPDGEGEALEVEDPQPESPEVEPPNTEFADLREWLSEKFDAIESEMKVMSARIDEDGTPAAFSPKDTPAKSKSVFKNFPSK